MRVAALAFVAIAALAAAAPAHAHAQLSAAQIGSVVRRAAPGVRMCYERELQRDPTFTAGRAVARFTIAPDGKVRAMQVSMTPPRPRLVACLSKQIERLRFAPPGSAITISYPFIWAASP